MEKSEKENKYKLTRYRDKKEGEDKCEDYDNLVELTQENADIVEFMIEENSSYAMTLQGEEDEKGIPPEIGFLEYLKKFVDSADKKDSAKIIDSTDTDDLNDKKDSEKFCGSTKWWVDELDGCEDKNYFKILIAGLIHNIDRTNSTHLNARTKDEKTDEPQGRKNIYKKIMEKLEGKEDIENLKDELEGIKDIKNKSKDEELLIGKIAKKDDKYKNDKFNLSFATKFCHYLSWYLFNKEEDKNMYAIYDSVVAETLPLYIEYIEKYQKEDQKKDDIKDIREKRYSHDNSSIKSFLKEPPFKKEQDDEKAILKFYATYMEIIDKVIEKGCEGSPKITRRQFDHLVWYSNKGKIPKKDKGFDEHLSKFKESLNEKQ